jgi:hypothetical protein
MLMVNDERGAHMGLESAFVLLAIGVGGFVSFVVAAYLV